MKSYPFRKNTLGSVLAAVMLFSGAVLCGCDDDEPGKPSAPAAKPEQQASVSQNTGPVIPNVKTDDKILQRNNTTDPELKMLVTDGDLFLDVYIPDTFGPQYIYQICIGEKCSTLNRDDKSGMFKYSCDKLNSKSPCATVMYVQACNTSDKSCVSKIIDFAGPMRAKKVVVGYEHACAIRLNNTVTCWGKTRGYANTDGTNSIVGTPADDIFLSRSQDVTCSIDPEHVFRCYGADAKRFKPIESLVRSASISINSICYVDLSGKAMCINADDEDQAYIAYTNPDGTDVTNLSDIRKIQTEEFYTVALDYKGKLHLLGLNLDNSLFRAMRETMQGIEELNKVSDFSAGNDAICAVTGDEKKLECFGPRMNFDYSKSDIVGMENVSKLSVGSQSNCVIYRGGDALNRVECGGIPFYYDGLKNGTEAIDVSQGNSQVCVIRPDYEVQCYGNDYHRNGVNFVPEDRVVVYDVNGVIQASLPKKWNDKIDNSQCRINAKYHEIVCRIAKFDFLPKDLRIKPNFIVNAIDAKIFVNGEPFFNEASSISIKPEQEITVKSRGGADLTYKLKLFQSMKVTRTYSLEKIWVDDGNSALEDFSCVWYFSDGTTDEGSCEVPMKHVFETDFAQNKNELYAKVDAYRKDVASGGFDVRHFTPKAID